MTTIQFLAEWTLRSSILILSGALLMRSLRVKDPSIRLAAWTAVLCGSLAIPALTAALPQVPIAMIRPLMPRVILPATETEVADYEIPVVPATTAFRQATDVPRHTAGISRNVDWARAAVIIYALIAAGLLVRLCAGLFLSARLLRGARSTGLATAGIEIRESTSVSAPAALGIVRPAIVLPSDWHEWDAAKLEAVLAHERSHVGRRDPAVQLLSAIHRALLWHSPLSWLLHRRIVRVAEEASDDAAVAATRDRVSYAATLLDFMQRGVRGASWQGVAMARYGLPEERIHRILDGTAVSRGVTRWSVVAILALGSPLAYVVAAAGTKGTLQSPVTPATSRLRPSVPAVVAPALIAQAATPPQAPAPASKPQQRTAASRTAEKPLTFDVASVKAATVPDGVTINGSMIMARRGVPIPRDTGGPGTGDPGRIHYPLVSLKDLLGRAYGSYFEIVGPGWLDTQVVQVDATMAPDTTKDQFREMLKNLITDRFGLKYHSEKKEVAGYVLEVAKSGPKMKESVDGGAQQQQDGGAQIQRSPLGSDGFPTQSPLPPGRPGLRIFFTNQGRRRVYGQEQTMHDLADSLASQLQQDAGGPTGARVIVTDNTGLTAKYDFALTFSRDGTPDAETLPGIFSALQSQLGLKLEPKKVPVDVMVIDHMEKTPAAN